MSEKEDSYIVNFNLEINESIAKITSEIDDKICDIWKINKQDIIDVINFKEKLIKHLEEKIKECKNTIELLEGTNSHRISILQVQIKSYEDILERVKSGKYD